MEGQLQPLMHKNDHHDVATGPNAMRSIDEEFDPANEEQNVIETNSSEVSASNIEADKNKSCSGKTKHCLQTLYKGAKSLVGLIILLVLYSVIGAALFMWIESHYEQRFKSNITSNRNTLLEQLSNISHVANSSEWTEFVESMLIEYESVVRDAVKNNVVTDSTVNVWNFWGSLFFTFTVYTSIGYGNIAPVTSVGRIVTIIYAAIGIPICFLLLAELGRRFTIAIKFVWSFVRRYYYTGYCRRIRKPLHKVHQLENDLKNDAVRENKAKNDEEVTENTSNGQSKTIYDYEVDDSFNLPISVAIAILLVYILLGAMMYSIWEEWNFVEAVYFVFISLATIGFGDVLPKHQKFFIFSSIYMFIGLSLVSMCITVAVEFFNEQAKRAKLKVEKAKKKIGAKVSEVQKKTREKVAEIKTNIADETLKIRLKTDEKLSHLRTNIADETSKLRHKAHEREIGIKQNNSAEKQKHRKTADAKLKNNSSGQSLNNEYAETEISEAKAQMAVPETNQPGNYQL